MTKRIFTRRTYSLAVVAALLLAPLLLAAMGCTATPAADLYKAKGAYVAALETVDRLPESRISPEAAKRMLKAKRAIDSAFSVAETATDGGDAFAAALAEVYRLLPDLIP